jgi:hypothetical protein
VYAFGAARHVVFDAKAGRSYRLIYGNSSAEAASYDYADTHARALYRAPNVALDAPFRFNVTAVDKTQLPWSEQHRWILWGALALAACGVGTLALRALSENDAT